MQHLWELGVIFIVCWLIVLPWWWAASAADPRRWPEERSWWAPSAESWPTWTLQCPRRTASRRTGTPPAPAGPSTLGDGSTFSAKPTHLSRLAAQTLLRTNQLNVKGEKLTRFTTPPLAGFAARSRRWKLDLLWGHLGHLLEEDLLQRLGHEHNVVRRLGENILLASLWCQDAKKLAGSAALKSHWGDNEQ